MRVLLQFTLITKQEKTKDNSTRDMRFYDYKQENTTKQNKAEKSDEWDVRDLEIHHQVCFKTC